MCKFCVDEHEKWDSLIYCDLDKWTDGSVYIADGHLVLSIQGQNSGKTEEVKLKCCPMCGRTFDAQS